MTVHPALFEILCCPACRSDLTNKQTMLRCCTCGREYTITAGIPDLAFFRSESDQDEFNGTQARHEAAVHDQEAQTDYEAKVIRVYGTKTRLIAENWSKVLEQSKAFRILDYGCGTGQLSRVFVLRHNPVYAFDISRASVEINIMANGVVGCVANAFCLPFKDNSFDAVCINGVLHHIVDLEGAINEISRITRNYVFISEGVPRKAPGVGRAILYPGLFRKSLYSAYALIWSLRYAFPSLIRRGVRKFLIHSQTLAMEGTNIAYGSDYERPLDVDEVESLFIELGFIRKSLCFYTNLDYPGINIIKKYITAYLINKNIGTHFELQLCRLNN